MTSSRASPGVGRSRQDRIRGRSSSRDSALRPNDQIRTNIGKPRLDLAIRQSRATDSETTHTHPRNFSRTVVPSQIRRRAAVISTAGQEFFAWSILTRLSFGKTSNDAFGREHDLQPAVTLYYEQRNFLTSAAVRLTSRRQLPVRHKKVYEMSADGRGERHRPRMLDRQVY
jgi:hypothetical protein